jgi:hypothetical protein
MPSTRPALTTNEIARRAYRAKIAVAFAECRSAVAQIRYDRAIDFADRGAWWARYLARQRQDIRAYRAELAALDSRESDYGVTCADASASDEAAQ